MPPAKHQPTQSKPPKSPFFHPSTPRNYHQAAALRQQLEQDGPDDELELPKLKAATDKNKSRLQKQQQHQAATEAKSNLVGCTANLMNAIVGSGIVGIAYSVQQAGLMAGVVLIGLCAVLTAKSLRLLVGTAKHAHTASYECVAEAAFGMAGYRFVAINMFIMAYGAMLSYLMIVKDSYAAVIGIESHDMAQKRKVLWICSLTIQVPLACQRDMANLAWTSRLSVLLDTILVLLVAYNAFWVQPVTAVPLSMDLLFDPDYWIRTETIFVGLGVLSFAFVCQHSAFLIAGSLERPTFQRWGKVTGYALVLCALLAWTSGLSGYLGYGEYVEGNILNNLDPNEWTANVARSMLGTTMLFVYPLESFVARHVCVALLFQGRRAHEGNDDADLLQRADRRIGLTVALYLLAVVPASLLQNVGSVLAVTGAIGGSCLAYIGPGMVYLGIHGERFWKLLMESKWFGAVARVEWDRRKALEKERQRERLNLLPTPAGVVVETTPLVNDLEKGGNPKEEQAPQDVGLCCFVAQRILWYSTGMPLWGAIAWLGKKSLNKHMHDLALKSPHPLRIGDVEYKKVIVTPPSTVSSKFLTGSKGSIHAANAPGGLIGPSASSLTSSHPSADQMKKLIRDNSLPLSNADGSRKTINQQIGQQLVQRQRNIEQQSEPLEKDPQDNPNAWDFFVAIFFNMFGILAFVAGLVSIAQEK